MLIPAALPVGTQPLIFVHPGPIKGVLAEQVSLSEGTHDKMVAVFCGLYWRPRSYGKCDYKRK